MKKIFFILSILISFVGVSQPVIQRSGPGNTVQDARWMGQYNAFIPRYSDTTAANVQKGIDSSGAIIYTYTGNTLWYRQSSPKKWVRLASGDGSNLGNSDLTQTDPQRTYNGDGGRLTFTNFNDLVFASFDRLQFLPLSSGVPTDSLLTWNNSTGEVRKISPSNIAGPCAPIVTILSDSTLSVCQCLKPDDCDTLEVSGGINNYYFTSDTTLIIVNNPTLVCDTIENADPALPDSIICKPIYTFDTLAFNNLAASFIFQNGLIQVAPKIIEQGGVFNRHTTISGRNAYNFRYDSLNFTVRGPYGLGQPIDTLFGPQFSFLPRKAALVAGYFNSQSVGQTDADVGPFTVNLQVNNTVNGNYSYAHGISNIVPGYVNTAWGEDNQLIGNRSTAWGQANTIPSVSYNATVGGGVGNIAAAHYPFVTGVYNQSYTYGGTVIGTYNDTTSKANEANSSIIFLTGRIFEIGNGTGRGGLRSNAMTVYNDRGKTIIGGHLVDSAAQLRLEATNLAFKPNSGNTTQMNSVVVPYNGLLYWNTDSLALCEYTDGEWRKVDRLGNTNTSIGGGYEVAVTGTNNVKSLFATSPITLDSTLNPNGITIGFDGSGVQDSTAFYYLSQLNDTTAVFHRRDGTADTLVISILQGGGGGGGGGSISLVAVGTNSNANAATLTGSVLNLEPANATYPGVVVSGAQTFPTGIKTFQRDIKVYNSIRIGRGVGDIVTNFVASPDALSGNTTGYQNVGIGYLAMSANTSGAQNVGISYQALQNNTTGGGNVAIGSSALKQNVSGDWNVAIGVGALQNNVDDGYSVAVGAGSLGANISTFRNTAVGYAAMADAQPDAYDNAAFGFNALRYLTTGQKNTAVGSAAMEEATTGYQNAFVGQDAALHLRTGYWNNGIGWLAGSLNQNGHSNLYLGTSSGRSVSSGDSSIFIGTNAGYNASQAVAVTNSIAIGTGVYTTTSDQIKIGNSQHSSIYLRGTLYWDDDPGTAGYVLTSQGAGLPAIWAAGGGGGGGSVISFTFTDANGFDGTVTSPTTTPTLSLNTTVANGRVMFSTSGAMTGSGGMTFNGTAALTLGETSNSTGSLLFKGSTSGTVTIQPANAAGTYTLTLPTNDGDASQFLQTNGSGVLSWATVSGSGSVTSFSAGNLSPLFTTNVADPTTTPSLTFTLSSAATYTWFGNNTSGSAAGAYNNVGAMTDVDDTNVTLTLGGNPAISLLNSTSLTLGWTGTLAATRGGTGQSAVATGDLLYGSATNTWSRRPAGADGYCLVMQGGVPVWAACGGGGPTTTPISSLINAAAVNDIENGAYVQVWNWSSLADNYGLRLNSASTTADDDQTLFGVTVSGANASASKRTIAAYFSNTHTGSTSTNVGIWTTASGGTTDNYGLVSIGKVGINNEAPLEDLSIGSALYSTTGTLGLYGTTSDKVVITVAAAAGGWTLTLPTNDGDNGQFLTTNGSGVTSWTTGSAGTVTDFIFTDANGFDGTVTTSTSTPTLSLTTTVTDSYVMFSNNGGVAGSSAMTYNNAGNLFLGAASASTGAISFRGTTSGTVTIKSADAAGTYTLTLPTDDGTPNQFLQTDGSGVLTWATGGSGVTDFIFTDGNGFDGTVTTSTTTPTLSLTTTVADLRVMYSSNGAITGDALMTYDAGGVLTLGATGSGLGQLRVYGNTAGRVIIRPNSSGTNWTLQLPANDGTVNQFLQTDGNGVTTWATGNAGTVTSFSSGNLSPLFTTSVSTATTTPALSFALSSAAGGTIFGNNQSSSGAPSYISTPVLGIAGSSAGTLTLSSLTSGYVVLQVVGAVTSYNFNLPLGAGSAGQVLTSQGGGSTAMTWTTPGTGTVTSVAAGAGMDFSTFTTSGNVIMGTPSNVTLVSTNSVSGTTHSHAFVPGGTDLQYIKGDGTLGTYGTATGVPISGLLVAVATNTINNANYNQEWQWNTLTSGAALKLSSTSTAAVDGQTLFQVAISGANATTELNTYAGKISNTHTGDGINVGLQVTATGGATNTGIEVTGTDRSIHAIGTMEVEGSFILETGGAATTINSAGNWTLTLPTSAGTSNYVLATNGSGVTSWVPQAGSITADNGLTMSTSTNVQLGGTLLANTTITTGVSYLKITTATAAATPAWITSTTGRALLVENTSTSQYTGTFNNNSTYGGLSVTSAGGDALVVQTSGSGVAIVGSTTDGPAASFSTSPSSTNSISSVLKLERNTSGSAANGIGASIDIYAEKGGVSALAGKIAYNWSNVTLGNSNLIISGVNANVSTEWLAILETGKIRGITYGVGTHTGTPAYDLQVDASGNFIEVSLGSTNVTDTRVMVASSGVMTGYAGLVFNGSGRLSLGAAGTADGSLKLFGNTDGSVTITAATTGDNWGMTLPAELGADGTVLTNAVSGVTTWSNIGILPFAYAAKTSVYTVTANDYTINCTSGTFDVDLPAVASVPAGKIYVIKNAGAGTITIDGNSTETIDGSETQTLSIQYSSLTIQSTGSEWIIIGSYTPSV